MLTQNLRKLEADAVVVRTDLSHVISHVRYDLNPEFRDSVLNLLDHLDRWGHQYRCWCATKAAANLKYSTLDKNIKRQAKPVSVESAAQ
jgi:DNA-binding HxlR family transcriptional regulator